MRRKERNRNSRYLKPESRILFLHKCSNDVTVALVYRGHSRIEAMFLGRDIDEVLKEFLSSSYSGEVRYYVTISVNNVDKSLRYLIPIEPSSIPYFQDVMKFLLTLCTELTTLINKIDTLRKKDIKGVQGLNNLSDKR